MIKFNRNPSTRDLRTFGLLLGLFTPLMGWLICRKLQVPAPWLPLAFATATLIVVSVAAPQLLRWVYLVWTAVTFPIGWVVSHVVLALVYWLVITPIGLALRACGKDPMQRGFDPSAASYWQERPRTRDKKSYYRPF
ncbi:MAG: SxtJ family membrane protein [Pirellulales bacterium]